MSQSREGWVAHRIAAVGNGRPLSPIEKPIEAEELAVANQRVEGCYCCQRLCVKRPCVDANGRECRQSDHVTQLVDDDNEVRWVCELCLRMGENACRLMIRTRKQARMAAALSDVSEREWMERSE